MTVGNVMLWGFVLHFSFFSFRLSSSSFWLSDFGSRVSSRAFQTSAKSPICWSTQDGFTCRGPLLKSEIQKHGTLASAKKEKSVSRDEPLDGETVNIPIFGFQVPVFGCQPSGFGYRESSWVQGLGIRVQGLGFRVDGLCFIFYA